jgi:hypothetical protein
MPETFFKVLHQLVSIRNFRIERHVNRESVRIPRRLRRGKRANHNKDRIPYGRKFPAAYCGDLQFVRWVLRCFDSEHETAYLVIRRYLDFLPYLRVQRQAYKERILHGQA